MYWVSGTCRNCVACGADGALASDKVCSRCSAGQALKGVGTACVPCGPGTVLTVRSRICAPSARATRSQTMARGAALLALLAVSQTLCRGMCAMCVQGERSQLTASQSVGLEKRV